MNMKNTDVTQVTEVIARCALTLSIRFNTEAGVATELCGKITKLLDLTTLDQMQPKTELPNAERTSAIQMMLDTAYRQADIEGARVTLLRQWYLGMEYLQVDLKGGTNEVRSAILSMIGAFTIYPVASAEDRVVFICNPGQVPLRSATIQEFGIKAFEDKAHEWGLTADEERVLCAMIAFNDQVVHLLEAGWSEQVIDQHWLYMMNGLPDILDLVRLLGYQEQID
jgi:hypothetical protein